MQNLFILKLLSFYNTISTIMDFKTSYKAFREYSSFVPQT